MCPERSDNNGWSFVFFCLGRKMTVVLTLVNCGGYLSKMCTYIYTQRERGACVHNSNSQTVVSPQSSDFHFVAHSSSHSLHIFLSFHIPIFLFPAFISRASWLFRIFSHDYFSCMTLKCTREWAGVTGMAAVGERNKNKENSLLGSSQIQGSDACRKIHTHTRRHPLYESLIILLWFIGADTLSCTGEWNFTFQAPVCDAAKGYPL